MSLRITSLTGRELLRLPTEIGSLGNSMRDNGVAKVFSLGVMADSM